ncbi:MAG: trigger factor [Ethanoligenens sp.]|uniref:trigger factor n=1 Tax=Ethanoligenens sp. TaxID=2099655 RepID=UPI0039EB1825
MSLTNSNKVDTNQYELEIAVDKDKFQEAVQKAYKKNVTKMNVPGFRKGHAPRSVVEKLYGEGVFFEDAVNSLYPVAYEEAVKSAGIEPVDRADIKIDKVDGDGFTFKATVTVKPEVEIGAYKGLKATKYIEKATDEDVTKEVDRVRDRNARVITVEDRAAEQGDITNINFEGFVDGTAFDGGKADGQDLELGSGQFIPGFEEQIVGHKTDEEFDVNVTFPEQYQAAELAGKPAVFKVKINEIKKRELPDLDDEFAKDVSEFDTLDSYKDDVRQHIQEHKDEHAQSDVEDALLDQVVEGLKAEIPAVMYERSIDSYVQDFDYRLQAQGLNLQTYLQYTGMDMDKFRETFQEQAEHQVKLRLALEKIAEIENFVVTDEDVEAEYKRLAEEYKTDIERIKTAIDRETTEKDIKINRAIDLVKDTGEVTEVEGINPKHQHHDHDHEEAQAE